MTEKELLSARIVPSPKEFDMIEGKKLKLCNHSSFRFTYPENMLFAGKTAISDIKSYLEIHCGKDCFDDEKGQINLRLEIKEAPKKVEIPEEGYQLEIKNKSIRINAFGESGLLYAVSSLKQLLQWDENGAVLPALKILDWPSYKLRGIKEESRFGSNLMELRDWLDMIDDMVSKKMNVLGLALYGCWNVQYDQKISEYLYVSLKDHPELKTPMVIKYYSPKDNKWVYDEKLPPIFEKDLLKDICRYAKERGITIVPSWNSYGHNTLIPRMIPEISAKDENGVIQENGFCTQNEKTYEFLFSAYDTIIDNYLAPYGFDMFSINCDEVHDGIGKYYKDLFKKTSPWCRCEKCRDIEKPDLFVDHVIKIAKHLKEKGIKQVIIAGDMIPADAVGGVGEIATKLFKAMEENDVKDVFTIDFWDYHDNKEKLNCKSFYPELGFRNYYCPWNGYSTWALLFNPLPNIRVMTELAERDGSQGCIAYSMYDRSCDRTHDAIAEYSWNKLEAGTEKDITKRYILRHFPNHLEEAMRAFKLLDDMTTENTFPTLSSSRWMMQNLSGYQACYIKANEPFPQPFIRYGLKYLLATYTATKNNRDSRERILTSFSAMALQAKNIFENIAKDIKCDTIMADRFAYECDNYICLCDDWIAVLEMYDLSLKGDYASIVPIARRREKARLELLKRLEATKEKYIIEAAAMRIQSTFLVSFRDIADYLEVDEKRSIDFLDPKEKFASSDYKWLR